MAAVRYSFSLDPIKDADLVRWLEVQANTSAAIREAIKSYVERPTHRELGIKLDRVLDALRNVRVVTPQMPAPDDEQGEPAAARRGLDAMKARFQR